MVILRPFTVLMVTTPASFDALPSGWVIWPYQRSRFSCVPPPLPGPKKKSTASASSVSVPTFGTRNCAARMSDGAGTRTHSLGCEKRNPAACVRTGSAHASELLPAARRIAKRTRMRARSVFERTPSTAGSGRYRSRTLSRAIPSCHRGGVPSPRELSVVDAAGLIARRDTVLCGFVSGQPKGILDALGARDDLDDVLLFTGILAAPYALLQNPKIRVRSGFFGPIERMARAAGARVDFLPGDFHGLERLALEMKPRVVLAVTTPPDADGWLSFGTH